MKKVWFLVTLTLLGAQVDVAAATWGTVMEERIPVYIEPSSRAEIVIFFRKGRQFRMSGRVIFRDELDADGKKVKVGWRKAQITNKLFGYVRVDGIRALELDQERAEAAMHENAPKPEDRVEHERSWVVGLRVMGLLGASVQEPTVALLYGGEGELMINLRPGASGYKGRQFGFGVGTLYLADVILPSAQLIYRIFTRVRVEPVLRIRYATNFSRHFLGASAGIRVPFTRSEGFHVGMYSEVSTLLEAPNLALIPIWASVGLGIHF